MTMVASASGAERSDGDVVHTRLCPPMRASGAVYRHRFDHYREEFRQRAVTIVKAPAGYGKSCLLGQWFEHLRRSDVAAGWLSMDPTPDDLMGFIRHVVASLQRSRPDFGQRLDVFFGAAARPSVAGVTATLTNLLAGVDESIFIFIDDFHLATDSDVIAAVCAVLERLPANVHVIFSSRHSLPFSLARLRAKGEVAEIDSQQLRFDNQEAAEFLRTSGHGALSLSEIDTMVSKTEGWPAGIQLAAILLARDRDTLFSLLEGRHKHLSEYLADDVINKLPADTVAFLTMTSILSRLCVDLCNAVTGRDDARRHIDDLERQSLFLFSLDGECVWYRYHHLFAGVLQRRLNGGGCGSAAGLHQRASAWFAQNGLVDEAFAHAFDAGDMDRAASILDQWCDRLLYNGRLSTLLRWADRLPPQALRPFPRVRLQAAFSHILAWRFAAAERIISEVEQDLARGVADDSVAPMRDAVDIRHIVSHRKLMLYHFMDDTPNTERVIHETISDFPEIDPYLRGNLETCQIYARREKYRLNNIARMDINARDYYEKAGSLFVCVWHEAILGPTYFLSGDTAMAVRSLETSMKTAIRIDGEISSLVAMPALLLADVHYERNECARAGDLLELYGPEGEKQGFVDHLVAFYVTRIRLAARAGDNGAVREGLREGHLSALRHGFTRLENFMFHEEMRHAVSEGDLDTVRRLRETLTSGMTDGASSPGTHTTTGDEPLAMALCRALSMLGEHGGAIRILRRWVSFAQARGAIRSEVRMLVLLALALSRDGREGDAQRAVREAVKKAARGRFIRSFIDEGHEVERLLSGLFAGADPVLGPTTAFGLELIGIFAGSSGVPVASANTSDRTLALDGNAPLSEPLNAREIEVVKLVSMGLSNREIGARLGMTEGSVKWYLQGIFAKLNVRRRSMVVMRARKFGIV